MSGHNLADGFGKTRPVLADVSNRKRNFSVFSGDPGIKFGDGYGKDGDSQSAKHVHLIVGNLAREECEPKFGMDEGKKIDTLEKNITSVLENLPDASKEVSTMFDNNAQLVIGETASERVLEVGDAARNSCMSSVLMPTCSGSSQKDHSEVGGKCQDEEVRFTSGVTQGKIIEEGFITRVCNDNEKDIDVGKSASSNHRSVEWSKLHKSQNSKFHEQGICTRPQGYGSDNETANTELLKGCSCSFCLKAAYILSDLHYQDIKGRIAVLKKSQKEANILVQQSCKGKETDVHGPGNCDKLLNSESDLTVHWRSLFRHMEDIIARESNQLQASFVKLKDLRENCKTDLEMINGTTSDKR